ncbi:MAG: PH domain-containing protein [Verrucomicrobiota bacterium]
MNSPLKSYLKETLQPGEKLYAAGGIHPAFLIGPGLWVVLTAWVIVTALHNSIIAANFPWIWVALIPPAIYFFQHWLVYMTTEAALTNCRVVAKSGFISRRIDEISLRKIESTAIDQGLIGRMFGFGDLVIRGSGGHSATTPGIEKVMEFRASVQNACR